MPPPTASVTDGDQDAQRLIDEIALVTVAGTTHFNRDYTARCMSTWSRISGITARWIVSDGLNEADKRRAEIDGFTVLERESVEVDGALSARPGLRIMRERIPTWRHVIDSVIGCRNFEYVLLIDTDVLVLQPIAISNQDLDYEYNCDDIPGFRGKFYLPLVEPMVPAINPGFFLCRPSAIDLDQLEDLVQRFFVKSKNYWWTRQSALSVLVARSDRRGVFSGQDVRVFSGNRKRSPSQIRANQWTFLGDSRMVSDPAWVTQCLEGAAVLHLAGRGKRWLHLAQGLEQPEGCPRVLRALPAPRATLLQSCLIALRMFAIQVR